MILHLLMKSITLYVAHIANLVLWEVSFCFYMIWYVEILLSCYYLSGETPTSLHQDEVNLGNNGSNIVTLFSRFWYVQSICQSDDSMIYYFFYSYGFTSATLISFLCWFEWIPLYSLAITPNSLCFEMILGMFMDHAACNNVSDKLQEPSNIIGIICFCSEGIQK